MQVIITRTLWATVIQYDGQQIDFDAIARTGRVTPKPQRRYDYDHTVTGILTNEHPESSYGIPVLLVDGVAHGPHDTIESCGWTALEWIAAWELQDADERTFAEDFCKSASPQG